MFIDPTERVPVYEFDPNEVISDEPPNIIFIRPKMDYATQKRVGTAGYKVGLKGKEDEFDVADNLIALMTFNIVGWSGPLFDGVPCTKENIQRLDPDQPVVEKALEEISRRNSKASPNPKSPATNGSTSETATVLITQEPNSDQALVTSGPPRSPLLRSLDGHRNRSGG